MVTRSFDLNGKVALITGGNGGIGLGMAKALLEAGAAVCLWGTNEAKNREAVAQISPNGGRAHAIVCDVGEELSVEQAFAETIDRFGRVDACFANAGVLGEASSFLELTTEEWRRITRVNLDGAFYTFRAAARHMVERGGGGSLVATSSIAALEGQPRGEHYAASKAGVLAMVRSLAVELARHGIRANAIVPGWVETAMVEERLGTDAFETKVKRRVPMRRWGAPADFGGIAVYLASDASAYHTGDTLVIDGGYTLF